MIVWVCVGLALATFIWWVIFKMSESDRAKLFADVKAKLAGFLLELILNAEQVYGSGMGQFKKAFVIEKILNCEFYKGLPLFIQKFVTYDLLSGMIDTLCETIFKAAQASNANLQKILK